MPNHRLLCILSPFLFFFFFSGSFHGVHSNFSAICDPDSPAFVCGNVEIRYPFWNIGDAAVHCGYSGFGLNCRATSIYPTLYLGDETYFVTNINYNNKNLTLVDADAAYQKCPRVQYNLTLDSLPLDYSSGNVNLTFFFNCTASLEASIPAGAVVIDCLQSGDNRSFVFVNKTWEEVAAFGDELGCEDAVLAPVKRTDLTVGNVLEEFAGAMTQGFVLDWGTAKECSNCELSSGRCAVNRNEQVLCFCDDETLHNNGSFCQVKERGLCPFIFLSILGNGFCILFARRCDCLFNDRHFSVASAWIPA